jgi:hypothetical protein
MELITIIATFFTGVAAGIYIASMIDKHIDKSISVTQHDRPDEFDTKNSEGTQIFKEDAVVKKIWNYTYKDSNGNEIEIPQQSTTGGTKHK